MSKRNRQKNKQRKQRVNLIPTGTRATALTTTADTVKPSIAPTFSTSINQPAPLMAGRQTQPSNANPLGALAYGFLPRRQWQDFDLTDLTSMRFFNAQQLLEILADIMPEVGQSLNNKLRLVNLGYKYTVRTKNGTAELKGAKARLDAFLSNVNKDAGGVDALINSWTSTGVLQGAIAGEITLTEDLSDVVDIFAIQPWTIYFERDANQALVPFQQQVALTTATIGGAYSGAGYPYKRLNTVTFGYVPVDAPPDDAYGRSHAAAALQLVPFYFQMLKDLRQWAHVNAWGKLDIKVLEEMIIKGAPPSVLNDITGTKRQEYVNGRLSAFRSAMATVKPDDAFVHTDAMEVGSVDMAGKTFAVDQIFNIIRKELFSALKELPILMGDNQGTTESHGSVQLVIYAATIKSFQKTIASLLTKLLNTALQVWGIAGKVEWEFEPMRATDRAMDAQADMQEATYAAYIRDQGWATQDEASILATGSEAVNKAGPIFREAKQAVNQVQGNNQNGTDQQGNKTDSQSQSDNGTPKGDGTPPDDSTKNSEDAKAA